MPPNTSWWSGYSAYQYARPKAPAGSKTAVCRIVDESPVACHLELQPGPSRDLHLRRKTKVMRRLERLDAPEVQRVADAEHGSVRSAPPNTNTSNQQIEEPAQPPEPVPCIPAGLTPDSLDGSECDRRRLRNLRRPRIHEP